MHPSMNRPGRRSSFIGLALALSLAFWSADAEAQQHPMDALTGPEVKAAVDLIRAGNYADDTSRFPTVTLLEMDKAAVLAWEPGQPLTRSAFVVMRHRGATYEFEIDLTNSVITTVREVDGQPTIIIDEWLRARELTVADPRWQAAMAQRGITEFENVTCSPLSAGYFAAKDYDDRRIMKVPCYIDEPDSSHLYGRPIAGLYTVVDVENGEVIEVVDTGIVEPAPEQKRERWRDEPLQPVVISSPQGRNWNASGAILIDWSKWSFHMRLDRRVGPIVSLIEFNDGGRERLIAYQMSLSEMFVPYMDPGPDWSYRTYLDSGEFGAGGLLSSLIPAAARPRQPPPRLRDDRNPHAPNPPASSASRSHPSGLASINRAHTSTRHPRSAPHHPPPPSPLPISP